MQKVAEEETRKKVERKQKPTENRTGAIDSVKQFGSYATYSKWKCVVVIANRAAINKLFSRDLLRCSVSF